MANRFLRATGNWNDTATWSATAGGAGDGVDVAYSSGYEGTSGGTQVQKLISFGDYY